MKTLGILLLQLLFITSVYGQQTEFSLHLNSGVSSFNGKSATAFSHLNIGAKTYTNNPYGNNYAPSYGLSVQIQRATVGNFVLGIQSGFESLRSSVHLIQVWDSNQDDYLDASGNTIFRHSFINFHPNIGYRIPLPNLEIDITAGPEVGFMLNSKEIVEAHLDNGGTVKAVNERSEEGSDYRLRSTLTIHYKKWGLSAGYSHGLRNYKRNFAGGSNQTYSRFIRVGISYTLFDY